MKAIYIKAVMIVIFVSLILSGCQKDHWTTTKEEFNIEEAKAIHRVTWDPVYQMVNEENVITPGIKVKSLEEFITEYGFTNMEDQAVKEYVFTLLINGDANNPEKDSEGYIVFGNDKMTVTADNLIGDAIYVDHAYIQIREWKEADITLTELVIVERSKPGNPRTDDFERFNYFKKNDEGNWILTNIGGNGISIISYNPDGD